MSKLPEGVTIEQIAEGTLKTYSGRHGRKEATVGQAFGVYLHGQWIGVVTRRLKTRESRSKGNRYVNYRWESPAWTYATDVLSRDFEGYSKLDCIERLVRDAKVQA